MGVLEIHIWGSQADQYEKPDRLIFDLDPDPTVEWPYVVTAAKEVRLLLEELGLISFIKTTGGKGLHVVVPIQRRTTWDDAKAFCRAVADFMVRAAPDRYIAKMSKAARKGKIFVDYLRNDLGATAIAPYSTRNRAGATVSVPISWEELSSSNQVGPLQYSKRSRTTCKAKEGSVGGYRKDQAIDYCFHAEKAPASITVRNHEVASWQPNERNEVQSQVPNFEQAGEGSFVSDLSRLKCKR